MSEPIIEPAIVDEATELATLRRVNQELLTKSATRKARVTELEASVTALQSKLAEADTNVYELTVGGPLKAMAESISISGELFLDQFNKSYKVQMVKGALTLLTADGKPVMKGDMPVPFERQALIDFLTEEGHPQAKVFNSILIISRASGAGSMPARRLSPEPKKPAIQFGLR